MSWIQLDATVSGNEPSRRHCHSCVSHQELIYIFGGTDGKDKFNDVHVFDTGDYHYIYLCICNLLIPRV